MTATDFDDHPQDPVPPSTLRARVYEALEGGFSTVRGSAVNGLIVGLIVANVIAVVLESDASLHRRYRAEFWALEIFSIAVFTIEYFFRVWVSVEAPSESGKTSWRIRLRYMVSPMAIIDLLAFAPFYIAFIFAIDLRYLRLLRLLRLLKLSHYFYGLDLFVDVLRSEARSIASAVMTVLMLIVVIASLMHSFEHEVQPEKFGTIAQSIWWSIVTLTTVGYGDATPVTFGGRVLASLMMLLGVGIIALPAGILAAKFSEELKTRKAHLAHHVSHALADGILDDEERKRLHLLREELRLPEQALEDLVKSHAGSITRRLRCPNCGTDIAVRINAGGEDD